MFGPGGTEQPRADPQFGPGGTRHMFGHQARAKK
jgi:hypothetical protein